MNLWSILKSKKWEFVENYFVVLVRIGFSSIFRSTLSLCSYAIISNCRCKVITFLH